MKPNRPPLPPLLAATLLSFFAPALPAQNAPAYPTPAPTPPAPATPAAPAAKDDPKAADSAPKIEGIAIARKDGRWLGLTLDGGKFKLRFYDKDKKPEKPDVALATARWNPVGKVGELRTVLNPAGNALVAPQFVSPPLTFRAYFTLLSADDQVVDSFVADLHGL